MWKYGKVSLQVNLRKKQAERLYHITTRQFTPAPAGARRGAAILLRERDLQRIRRNRIINITLARFADVNDIAGLQIAGLPLVRSFMRESFFIGF